MQDALLHLTLLGFLFSVVRDDAMRERRVDGGAVEG